MNPSHDDHIDSVDYSVGSTPTLISSPLSPIHHRSGYRPIAALPQEDTAYAGAQTRPDRDIVGGSYRARAANHGLAIENLDTQPTASISRVPVGGRSPRVVSMGADSLLSPSSTRLGRDSSQSLNKEFEDEMGDLGRSHSTSRLFQPFMADSELEDLNRKNPADTIRSSDSPSPDFECRSVGSLHHSRANWTSIIILILAVYSTVFSGIWLVLAIVRPRYGRRISTYSRLPPTTASILCTAFAKSIELSFVTVFVAFLGQVLSRRALIKASKGVTIAEMTMRAWVMQPGTLFTHWETVRHAALTFLGALALIAALLAMLYTTASDALVAPKLKFGKTETRVIYGKVATQFANPNYIKDNCQTPIPKTVDPVYYGDTCMEITHSGLAYHNYQQYLAQWTHRIGEGNITSRPDGVGLMYDNTTVYGSWINKLNMTEVSEKFGGRIINNVSMAMPHAGVFAAARDPINDIMQPQDLNGLGEYHIRASVPSPVVNILCAGMEWEDLRPMIYSQWPHAVNGSKFDLTKWPDYDLPGPPSWLNKTSVDDVFGFGEKYGRRHPVFAKYPLEYNTILNTTKAWVDSLYLLGASPNGTSPPYMLCAIRQSQTPVCSTDYQASLSGGSLTSRCDDPSDDLAYQRSDPSATNGVLNRDWINVAIDWATALSLNAGITDGKASIARLLTQLIPTSSTLNPSLPSIAEALAVMAGSTLIVSSYDAPFIHYWNYSSTVPILATPQYQGFNATVKSQDYASGGTRPWQGVFYIVLVSMFAINVFCLAYFLLRGGLVTDFIELQNLFALSLNSPPSRRLQGSCGTGPNAEQLRTKYFVTLDEPHNHVYIHEGDLQPQPRKPRHRRRSLDYHLHDNPVAASYSKLSNKRTSFL